MAQMPSKPLQTFKFAFPVLEIRPVGSQDPQGNRVLECVEFSKHGLVLSGVSRFERFPVILSMPQNGERVSAEVEVVSSSKGFFEVKFLSPSKQLLDLISWWAKGRGSASQASSSVLDSDTGA